MLVGSQAAKKWIPQNSATALQNLSLYDVMYDMYVCFHQQLLDSAMKTDDSKFCPFTRGKLSYV